MRNFKPLLVSPLLAAALFATACNGKSNSLPNAQGYLNTSSTALNEASAFTPDFAPSTPNTPNSVQVTVSGELLGENGLPFNPVNTGDPVFVDGWSVSFVHYIVVIGNVRLSPNALQYSDQETLNAPVATRAGPYAIDLHNLGGQGTNNGFTGADGAEPAGGLFVWNAQDDGKAFDTSTLYAFSYDTIQATLPATNVNLTDDEFTLYQTMIANGWDKYIEGVATYVGTSDCPDPTTCDVPLANGKTIRQEFQAVDAVSPFHFKFGWNDHTSSHNCINPFNGNGDEANLANRGVQPNSDGAVRAQVTVHTDHVFWDTLKLEGTPLRMILAAWAVGTPTTAASPLDLGTLATKPIAPVTFADGTPIPDRGLVQTQGETTVYPTSDQTNQAAISLNLNGVPSSNIAGLSNFMAFSAQSQTHLNANGLCYIVGQNASDPFYLPDVTP